MSEMWKLYFQHANGDLEFVCEADKEGFYVGKALDDLYNRAPHFQSYYQRVWQEDNGWIWIDVGSHTEFYILKEN